MAKFTDAMDDKMDKKAGIKEGSKRDIALDKKRGVPETEKYARGGAVKKSKPASKPMPAMPPQAAGQPMQPQMAQNPMGSPVGLASGGRACYSNGGPVFSNSSGGAKTYRK
jgi:hypothetical protein